PHICSEVSRLLIPGGYFIASFDYWPSKIDTGAQKLFGLSWTIFSTDEVRSFLSTAASCGLAAVGETKTEAATRVVRHAGRDYTFAWLVLRKIATRKRGS